MTEGGQGRGKALEVLGQLSISPEPGEGAPDSAAALPDFFRLLISDEVNKRAVSVQVVQRTGDGIVRGIATTEVDAVPRGATVLNTGQQTPTPVYRIGFERIAAAARPQLRDPRRQRAQADQDRHQGHRRDVPACRRRHRCAGRRIWRGGLLSSEELVRRLGGGANRCRCSC